MTLKYNLDRCCIKIIKKNLLESFLMYGVA